MADAPNPRRRWFHLTPDRCVVGLLAVEGLLWVWEWSQWSPKGWPVLIALATIGAAMLLMLVWFAVALLFRGRFQFSIRALLLLTLAVALPFSWLATEMKQAREQQEAIAEIGTRGSFSYGMVIHATFDCIVTYATPSGRESAPRWLRDLLGDDFFNSVVILDLSARYPSPPITDAGLEHVRGLTQLRELTLNRNEITDAGLAHLEGLTQLQTLDLEHTKITDAGLAHLEGLTKLQSLGLAQTRITDAGLTHLARLTQLQSLDLAWTKITDAGLERLEGMTRLERLGLNFTVATDTGLRHLESLPQVHELELAGTQITDAGLRKLMGLKQLQKLDVCANQVTNEGVKMLMEALPNCEFVGYTRPANSRRQ